MVPGTVDSHQHFWRVGRFDYPWMPESGPLRRDFLPADLEPELTARGVSRTVLVQASDSLDETRWMLDLADANPFVAGVVGWVDLASPDVARDLDALADRPKLKGIRHIVESEPDDAWLVRPEVLAGLRALAERGLSYDLLVHTRHLDHVLRVADACPGLRLVLDHAAKPPVAGGDLDAWARGIERVAEIDGLVCKLSGLATEAGPAWTDDDLRGCVEHVVSRFGAERLLFGSDWPVCLLAGSYARVTGSLEALCAGLDARERALAFRENAERVYRLGNLT